jgi:hypothetical protein
MVFHDVAEGMTFNIRAVIDPIARTLDVAMRDFVAGAPPMHDYAKAVPFVSNGAGDAVHARRGGRRHRRH